MIEKMLEQDLNVCQEINEGISKYLIEHNMKDVQSLVGSLNLN